MKTFIRTIASDNMIICSWYDKNGKRYKNEVGMHKFHFPTVKDCDDAGGYMSYARQHDFKIIDNFVGIHPTRMSA